MIAIKRVYEKPRAKDGLRVLVDRLWPRGLSKERAAVDWWAKDLAPSSELRKWFGHDPARWPEFKVRYRAELTGPDQSRTLDALAERARHGRVTLVFGARDTEHSQARVIADELERRLGGAPHQASSGGQASEPAAGEPDDAYDRVDEQSEQSFPASDSPSWGRLSL